MTFSQLVYDGEEIFWGDSPNVCVQDASVVDSARFF